VHEDACQREGHRKARAEAADNIFFSKQRGEHVGANLYTLDARDFKPSSGDPC
jgi:hypothetical protein